MVAIVGIASLASLVAIAGIIYPFRPFGRRRNAFLVLVACLVLIIATTPSPGVKESEVSEAREPSTPEPTKNDGGISAGRDQLQLEAKVRQAVETFRWPSARMSFGRLVISGMATEDFKDEIERLALERIRPLPASEHRANLDGYEFLAEVRPKNTEYAAKVGHYEGAMQAARNRILSKLRKSVDKVEGVTWYKHPNQPRFVNSRSTVYLYIGRRGDSGRPWLRMQVQYTSSRWLFVERVYAWHDGTKEQLTSGPFSRDSNTEIWEWVDVSPNGYQIDILRSLAHAEEAVLRFEGNQYRRDVTLSSGDKRALRDMLLAHEVLGESLR